LYNDRFGVILIFTALWFCILSIKVLLTKPSISKYQFGGHKYAASSSQSHQRGGLSFSFPYLGVVLGLL
jgi:hypothetical protein